MLSTRWIFGGAALSLAVAACGNGNGATSSGDTTGGTGGTGTASSSAVGTGGGTGGASTGTGSGASSSAAGTGGSGTGGNPASCAPTPGTSVVTVACDQLQIAVLAHDGAPSDVRLTGRLSPTSTPMPTCAVIDGVDILAGGMGSAVVQHLPGGQSVTLNGEEALLATGTPPVADLVSRCASDDAAHRFDVYGIVVSGHLDGGTFQAQCALAQLGSSWPPALRVTCHKNVDEPPVYGSASVMTTVFSGMTFSQTMLSGQVPHDQGGAIQTLDPTLHIIAQRSFLDNGAPIPSFDTTGWTADVSEESPPTPPDSELSFNAGSNLLGTAVCPPGQGGPTPTPTPAFLARATGTGQHGAFSTEIYVAACIAE